MSLIALLVLRAQAQDFGYIAILQQSRAAIVGKDYKTAKTLLTAAEAAAPSSTSPLAEQDIATLWFYRGLIEWRAGDKDSAALNYWRQALVLAPRFAPDTELLPEMDGQDVLYALASEVANYPQAVVNLPEDPGDSLIFIDGRRLEPFDSIPNGRHLVQVRCADGNVVGSWHTYGSPPSDYLTLCSGGQFAVGKGGPKPPKVDKKAQKSAADKALAEKAAADKAEKAAADKALADAAAADKAAKVAADKTLADAAAADKAAKAAAEKAIADKALADKAAADKVNADKALADKATADLATKAAADKAATEKAAAEQAAKLAADKAAADKALADKASGDKATADKAAKAAAEKVAADKLAGDKAAADKALADKTTADKAAANKAIADKAAADKALADRSAGEKAAAVKAAADKAAADKAAAERATGDKATADKANKAAAEKAAADRAAADKATKIAKKENDDKGKAPSIPGVALMAGGGALLAAGGAVNFLVVNPAYDLITAANKQPGSLDADGAGTVEGQFTTGKYATLGLVGAGVAALGVGVVVTLIDDDATLFIAPNGVGLTGRW